MAVRIKYKPVTTDITYVDISSRYSFEEFIVSKQKNKINVWTLHFKISFISSWSFIIGLIVKLIMYCTAIINVKTAIIMKIDPPKKVLKIPHHNGSQVPPNKPPV